MQPAGLAGRDPGETNYPKGRGDARRHLCRGASTWLPSSTPQPLDSGGSRGTLDGVGTLPTFSFVWGKGGGCYSPFPLSMIRKV